MSKQQMIDSMKTAGIVDPYVDILESMTIEEVREEYKKFGQSMKD